MGHSASQGPTNFKYNEQYGRKNFVTLKKNVLKSAFKMLVDEPVESHLVAAKKQTGFLGFSRERKNPFSLKKLYPQKISRVRTMVNFDKPKWAANRKETVRITGRDL